MKPIYDRAAIMREANRLTRAGMPRAAATSAAWANAKKHAFLSQPSRQQEAGLRAALKRYGVDPDRIAQRAQEAVHTLVAAVAARPALLPPPKGVSTADTLTLTRGADGVYRF